MLKEAELQYKDYYESDSEEKGFFEYLDTMTHRDKIWFMEIFEDFTINKNDSRYMVSIPKRENNPELSIFANLALDLVDFWDRVRPMASDMALLDKSSEYQRRNVSEVEWEISENKRMKAELPGSKELDDKPVKTKWAWKLPKE